MDKKTKIFFLVFFLLLVGSVAFAYYRIMVKRNYIVESQIDCDPAEETCFVWECDPDSDDEWEACTGDPEEDIWYYKVVRRNASKVPLCDPNEDEECEPFLCGEGEKDCEEVICDDETAEFYEAECSNPEKYLAENPLDEEEEAEVEEAEEPEDLGVSCEEGGETCLIPAEELEGSQETGEDLEGSGSETEEEPAERELFPVTGEGSGESNEPEKTL